MADETLSERTRKILDDDSQGFNTFISRFSGLAVSVWYSAVDGQIYSKGPRNPASIDSRYQSSELKCLVVKADLRGRPTPRIAGSPQIEGIVSKIEGEPSDYAIQRVLEQIRQYKKELDQKAE
jgi:hypothetical protein